MKAISLWQPWASAIAVGIKKIETRHWPIGYRGEIAIHAAKTQEGVKQLIGIGRGDLIKQVVRLNPSDELLPLGAIVAVARLDGCYRVDQVEPSEYEAAWGDFSVGRYCWMLSHVVALPKPIPYRGQQGLFEIPDDLLSIKKPRD